MNPTRASGSSARHWAKPGHGRSPFGLSLCFWGLAAGLWLHAAPAPAENSEAKTETVVWTNEMKFVLGLARPADADLLLLRNGDKLAGLLQNKAFSLRTASGTISFERRVVAGLDFADGANPLDAVVTINDNRFSGFLDDPVLILKSKSEAPIEVRRERVLKAIFPARSGELEGIPRQQFVQLKNGDYFTGRILHDPLQFTTTEGPVSFGPADFESLKFVRGNTALTEVVRRDGRTQRGSLANEDIEIQLDVGPKVRVYQERIEVIYGRAGFTPPGLRSWITRRPLEEKLMRPNAGNPEGIEIEGMVWIPPGEFIMGSPSNEGDRDLDEGPQTKVIIKQGFWMAKCEITQAEYESVIGTNPSQYTGDLRRPVEKVSWHDALRYCARLTQLAQAAGKLPAGYGYRLPTEAEWEYACRAGTSTRFCYGNDPVYLKIGEYAWFNGNAGSGTHPVGTKMPNAWGLYDMHGNVLEWCMDSSTGSLPGGTVTNAPAAPTGSLRIARGGSWLYDAKFSRAANRDDYSPSNQCSDLGFRVVLAPSEP